MLIAIEGVDGAGKRTLCQGLRAAFGAGGKSVATLAFPRYGQSVTADLAAEALHGFAEARGDGGGVRDVGCYRERFGAGRTCLARHPNLTGPDRRTLPRVPFCSSPAVKVAACTHSEIEICHD